MQSDGNQDKVSNLQKKCLAGHGASRTTLQTPYERSRQGTELKPDICQAILSQPYST